jgi:hypothetical protein
MYFLAFIILFCEVKEEKMKLSKYKYAFFTILYIFMSLAWGKGGEYGKCYVPLDDPKMIALKPFFLGTNIASVGVQITWHVQDRVLKKISSNLQTGGRRSSIDENTINFNDTVSPRANPPLAHFSGIYQNKRGIEDNEEEVFYDINMFPSGEENFRNWTILLTPPYNPKTTDRTTLQRIAIDMKCRVDYQSDEGEIRTFYSPSLLPDEKKHLDKDFKGLQKKDFDTDTLVGGRTNNITNADFYFCAFDVPSQKALPKPKLIRAKKMRYLSWALFDEGAAGNMIAVRNSIFDHFTFDNENKIVNIGKVETSPQFNYTLQKASQETPNYSKMIEALRGLPVPEEIKKLKDFQGSTRELWTVTAGVDKSNVLRKLPQAICYKWRTILDTIDLQRKMDVVNDAKIVNDIIKESWKSKEEKKD